jgi:uncharacterized membrane protein required for colicin V production
MRASKPIVIVASILLSIVAVATVVLLNYLVTTYLIEINNSDTGLGLVFQGLKSVVVVIIALLVSAIVFISTISKKK